MADESRDSAAMPLKQPAFSRENIGLARDSAKFLLEIAIVVLIVYCLLRPQIVSNWLSALGVSKITILGIELTPSNAQEISDAVQQITQQRDDAIASGNRNQEIALAARQELERLRGSLPAQSSQAEQIDRAIQQIGPVAPAIAPPQPTQLQRTIIQSAREEGSGNARWAVVYGGDGTPAAAEAELNWGRARGLNVALFFRQRSYRSVAFATDAANAASILETVRDRRRDAYIVNFNTWCPNRQDGEGFDTCA